MKKVVQLLVSGLIGIGIGMTWIVVQILLQSSWNNLANSTLKISDFLFWILESFLIGIFFMFAGERFTTQDSWFSFMPLLLSADLILSLLSCTA